MGSLKAEELVREFHYNGVLIPDPGPELTVDRVRDLLAPNFREIATASKSGPEATGSVLRSASAAWSSPWSRPASALSDLPEVRQNLFADNHLKIR